ncbi:4-aminobutyrate--2-oxoglutarate transaminase [Limnochorda pilosa]|uniref:(S)-3-amino-2-methylpropionate transaminase n=1 Tax=Limnochorda pilosa TaxID=1555112 RepID=A0A0K2SQ56_LIMPI|nr:4-aminobutyrate--2-oxoglutarate transaminase [Limnochorda pilosa]BAS29142.1 4-aminobutyrate aminotransferase [Limnochorda pilosa]
MGKAIRQVTEIPGPRSRALLARKDRAVAAAFQILTGIAIDRAEGSRVVDVDGNTYLDLTGGLGVLNAGHRHPRVMERVQRQLERFVHTDFSVVMYESWIELAERLAPRVPGPGPKKAAFFNSGAEAVENVVKIAKAYTGRRAVIAFEGAFHGRTLMAMSLTSKTHPYKAGFGPFAPEVYRVPYAYCYRCPLGKSYPECGVACAGELEKAFVTQVAAEEVACVVVEAVQGEGGFVVPPAEFLQRIQAICRDHGILLVVDEVQTGFGRTGTFFASERFGLEPDLITVAKSIADGWPLSGVIGRAEVMDAPGDGRIGGTYVGNPVACEAALGVLDVFDHEDLLGKARTLGDHLLRRLEGMQERHPLVGDVRGAGPMAAMELVRDRMSKEPAAQETNRLLQEALQRGVLLVKAGVHGNVVRFLNSLAMSVEELDEALDAVDGALAAVEAHQR